MKKQHFLFYFIILTLSAALVWNFYAIRPSFPNNPAANVYERVLKSQTLRCGFFEEEPFTIINPNTKSKSGIAVELATRVATELNLKIEWTPVSNFTTLSEDLRMGRYDAICASVFNIPRAGRIDYTKPYIYVPVKAYTQTTHKDFPSFDRIDWTHTKIAGLDGEGATTIARKRLPNAQFILLPDLSSIPDMLNSLASNKADIAFVMPTVFANYDHNNPGILKAVPSDHPFHIFPVSFAVKPDEAAFKDMLDGVIRNLQTSGELDQIIDKYDPNHLLYRAQDGYKR